MTATGFQSQLSTYVSGAALGVIALIAMLAPHVRFVDATPPRPADVCVGRMSADQAVALRAAVIDAESRRADLVHGGSIYAAAKLGPSSDAGFAEADHALAQARAAFVAGCG